MKSEKRGFTLIELLVVIAIIGLLASIVLASLNSARKKSRDARRIADLKQLQNALELYANDNSGNYPSNAVTAAAAGEASGAATAGGLVARLVPTFIPAIPSDPLGGTITYVYWAQPGSVAAPQTATSYCLGAKLEGTTLPTPANTCQTALFTIASGDSDTGTATVAPNYAVGN